MRRWFDRLSIRAQVALLVAAVALPLGAMLVWLLLQTLDQARRAAFARVELVAAAATEDIALYLQQTEFALGQVATRERVRALDPQRCEPMLGDYLVLQPEIVGCGVRDLAGRLVCGCRAEDLSAAEGGPFRWLAELQRAKGFYVSDSFVSAPLGRRVALFVHPIVGERNRRIGYLELPVDLQRLGERLLAVLPADAEVTVLDRNSIVLMRSHAAQVAAAAAASKEVWSDQRERVSSHRAVAGVDWTVVAAMPAAEVFAGYDAIVLRTAGVCAALVLVAAVLTARRAAAIAQPISALAQTAKAAAAGDTIARAEPGGPLEVATVAHEINRMLDARHFSEARLRGVIDSATDAILTADESQTIVMANPAAGRMFRCGLESLVGSSIERWMPERFRPRHHDDMANFGAGAIRSRSMGRSRDVIAMRADGEEFPVDAAISHVEVGKQRLYTVILRDITERRRVEEALRASEARTRRLMSLLPHAVFVDSGGRFAFVNAAAQQLFGLGEAQLLDQPVFNHIHPDSAAAMQSHIATLREGRPLLTPSELQVVRADGTVRLVEAVATWFEDHGSTSLLVVLHDITELKQAQIALRESHADLRRLVDAQDKLLENERRRVARELHDDLQQTLAAIRIDLGAIGEQLSADPGMVAPMLAEVDDLAAAAIASTRRIVNDLRPRMLEDLGLGPALEALAAAFQQRTGIATRVDADPRASDAALASAATTICLYRVAQESLNNVAKHAQARSATIDLELTDEGRLVLRVIDDGQGFADDARRKPESFGLLGMHERVRALDGSVRVESEPGAGTTVEVDLPTPAADLPPRYAAGARRPD